MKQSKSEMAVMALRLVLGVVVVVQSFLFLFGDQSARFFASHGLPQVIRHVLGWTELIAAILFMVPATVAIGAWALLIVFCGAIGFHLAHGQYEVGGLFVYAAAVLVVLTRPPSHRTRSL